MGLLQSLKPESLKPKWECQNCGKSYRRNRRSCSNCDSTVFDKLR
ncbi:hypothetical protein HALDL1_10655 [Halobacterium sp. DL1]|jgi:rubrerythrin|nr:hypothetical protein HALDL1_10655 [Halobacterium sp. DL1]